MGVEPMRARHNALRSVKTHRLAGLLLIPTEKATSKTMLKRVSSLVQLVYKHIRLLSSPIAL